MSKKNKARYRRIIVKKYGASGMREEVLAKIIKALLEYNRKKV